MTYEWTSIESGATCSPDKVPEHVAGHLRAAERARMQAKLEAAMSGRWRARMRPLDAIKSVFDHYDDFGGRASRLELWWWTTSIVTGLGALLFVSRWLPGIAFIVGLVAAVIVTVPTLAVTVRRVHDAGHSSVWILTALIPAIGWWLLGALLLVESEESPNDYGPPPPGSGYADPSTWLTTMPKPSRMAV